MTTTATVNSSPITATVAGGAVSASVTSSSSTVSVAASIGPHSVVLSAAGDVQLANLAEGDLLRYSANKWRNHAEGDLIIDGQNF